MDSFSQRERFVWMGDTFNVMIPNGSRTAYHPRASVAQLKALLIPEIRLTRAGNISTHQPTPPPPQPYDFYLAQLVHYGLDFHFDSESAQRDLEIQIRLGRLQVPPSLLELEKELRRAHVWKQNEAYDKAVRNAAKQLRSHSVDAAKHEPEHEPSQSPGTPKAAKRSLEKKKAEMDRSDDETSSSGPDDETSSSGPDGDSGDESDTIAVARDALQDTSSDSSSSSSSERSALVLSGSNNMNKPSSKRSKKKSKGGDDPFVDRQDFKRVKLDIADEQHDSSLKSSREAVSSVVRKQPPPSQVKIRRITSQPLVTEQPINSTTKQKLDTPAVNASFAFTSNLPPHNPSVNPHKRPSWNLPVRSPSSAQKDSPKSVTFSQVQRETPTRVPLAEKATFSSAMKTPDRGQHRRTPSESFDHSHTTPLRSILKNTATPLQHHTAGNNREPEISRQLPPHANTSASRPRKRKRKSKVGSSLGLHLDGARDQPDTSDDDSYKGKPHIVSDIVNGIPISSLTNGNHAQLRQKSPQHESSRVDNNRRDWVAVNASTYRPQQQQQQQQQWEEKKVVSKQDSAGRPSPLSQMHSVGKLDEPISEKVKTGGDGLNGGRRDVGKNGIGNGNRNRRSLLGNGQSGDMGVGMRGASSGSRGGLVRAGEVY
jgi:hypothetical protein